MFSAFVFTDGLPTEALFAEFTLAALIVILAGARFTKAADELGERLGWASGWVGLILLATVTSLPELVAGITATWIGNVDLALGTIFGSCSFNITLIVLLSALWGGGSISRGVGPSHVLTSSFGVALISLALLGVVAMDKFQLQPGTAKVCELIWAAVIAVTYPWCVRLTYTFEKKVSPATAGLDEGPRSVERALPTRLVLLATVIVASSWWLAQIGDTLGTHRIEMIGRPLGATFVGAAFLALATSLPEIVTSVAAVRLGNLDLALGNIFGSNMFNIFVIPLLKLVSLGSGQSQLIAPGGANNVQNLIVGLLAIMLTAIALCGLTYKSERRLLRRFGFDSILIAVGYIGGMALLLTRPE